MICGLVRDLQREHGWGSVEIEPGSFQHCKEKRIYKGCL